MDIYINSYTALYFYFYFTTGISFKAGRTCMISLPGQSKDYRRAAAFCTHTGEVQWWTAADHSGLHCSSLVGWLAASWPRRWHDASAVWAWAGGKSTYWQYGSRDAWHMSLLSSSNLLRGHGQHRSAERPLSQSWGYWESMTVDGGMSEGRTKSILSLRRSVAAVDAHRSCRLLMQDIRRWQL